MRKYSVIRPLVSLVMVLLFLVSNTPRQLMHDLFAHHRDGKGTASSINRGEGLHTASFHCQCDNLVAESPFTTPSPTGFSNHYTFSYLRFYAAHYQYTDGDFYHYFSLRAPPRNDVSSLNVNS